MSECHHNHNVNPSVCQSLDELDFERGIWFAAQKNDFERVKKLLKNGANVDQVDRAGYTALHYASRNGHLELCKLLLLHNADVNSLTRAGRASSLHRSASAGHMDVFKLLLTSGAKIDLKDADGRTVLHRATEGGHQGIVKMILEYHPNLAQVKDNRGALPIQLTESVSIENLFKDYGVLK